MKKYKYNGRTVPGMYQGKFQKKGETGDGMYQKGKPLRGKGFNHNYDHDARKKKTKENFEHSKKKLKELGHLLTFGLFRKTGGSTGNGPNGML